jgi:hypothetical protein
MSKIGIFLLSRKSYKVHILALSGFIFITWLFFPKLFSGFFTHVETNDGRLVAWILSWDIHSLFKHPLGIFDANYFFPTTNNLCYSEHFIGTALLGMPVWIATGGNPAATFNFVMIISFVLTAYCSFLLIRKLINHNGIAFLGAVINGFCSYRLYNIGHLQNVTIFYIPLCLLFFYKFLESKRLKHLIGVGLCLYLQSISSWYHMIFIFLMMACFIAYYFFIEKKITIRELMKVIVMMVVVFAFIIPFAIPYFKFNKESNTAFSLGDVLSSDIGGYLIPAPYTFGNGIFSNYLGISKSRWLENFNYIGYVSLLFSIFGLFKLYRNANRAPRLQLQKQNLVFILVAGVFVVCSFGPFFIFNDEGTDLKLPYYALFKWFGSIRFLRCVARYSTVVFLMMSILASFGLVQVLTNITEAVYRRVIYVLILGLIFIEYAPMERFNRFSDMSAVPAVFNKIKQDKDIKSLVELPINVDPFTTTKYLYFAGIHFKPIVNGYNGFTPPTYYQFKETFDAPINEFTSALLNKIGVTHILCNPEYKEVIDTSYAMLMMEKEGYRLYKIKPVAAVSYYVDNIQQWPAITPSKDSSLRLKREINGISSMENLNPEKIDTAGSITYTSNKPLHMAFIQFRAYGETDTLQMKCVRTEVNKKDSVIKTYTFVKKNEFDNTLMPLPLYEANKVIFRLRASEFKDRTRIKNLAFTSRN